MNIKITKLKVLPDERGYLQEILRNDSNQFKEFGQVYCTATYPNVVKGWHYHEKQTDNICCIKGMIKLVVSDETEFKVFYIGEQNPCLVTILPNLWHGWKTISQEASLVINISDKVYDYNNPDEKRIPPHGTLNYDWEREDR